MLASAVLLLIGAGGAVAAFESDTVPTFAAGLWWAVSLLTTVGFIGEPPRSDVGVVASVVLMLAGFGLLALVSAALASLFVRQDESPGMRRGARADETELHELRRIAQRLDRLDGTGRQRLRRPASGQRLRRSRVLRGP
jgi:voltage-gated potassium channel